jgi:uncharacterized protein YifN (PemK superfamily)
MCDFGPDPKDPATFPLRKPPVGMPPELWKVRQVAVVSPAVLNHRHALGPGLCLVIPFSASPPVTPEPWDVFFVAKSYQSLTRDSWAKCASVTLVSHHRLERPFGRPGRVAEYLSAKDLDRIGAGLKAALGLA